MSSLYYIRKFPLKVGGSIQMKVAEGKKLWDMTIDVVKKERLKIKKLGTFEAYQIIPKFQFDGMFVKKGDPSVWLHSEKGYPLYSSHQWWRVPDPGGRLAARRADANPAAAHPVD